MANPNGNPEYVHRHATPALIGCLAINKTNSCCHWFIRHKHEYIMSEPASGDLAWQEFGFKDCCSHLHDLHIRKAEGHSCTSVHAKMAWHVAKDYNRRLKVACFEQNSPRLARFVTFDELGLAVNC